MYSVSTLKNAGFQLKFGSNMNKPKCWVKNLIKKIKKLKVKVEVKILCAYLTLSKVLF